ncbi:hypothetical protein BU23DRAFT_663599 [Bimuria novae-zelandiae CBS 107.79]|uniref:Uncharacterized protein n=1 Tax=Bimuria novae-zelandiae CBS 107.79 TaxID=1447943 RepID=A0A6A5UTJ9_9PLEO|nr:hypothetical protein BU23DRAFT_663599 [Bimuria novae-zelandiae CBS 107.79]
MASPYNLKHKMAATKPSLKNSGRRPDRRKKTVTFALRDSVKVIPCGYGTWENGPPMADNPMPWAIENSEKLVTQSLAQIRSLEQVEAARRPQNGPRPMTPRFIVVQKHPKRTETGANSNFDSFLNPEQLSSGETLRHKNRTRSSSLKSLTSIASMKSLSKVFKKKMG